MTLTIYTDGGSRGNPGPASIGIIAYIDDLEVFAYSGMIGIATNNVAEYTAVITTYEKLSSQIEKLGVTKMHFKSDSKLLVEQLSGRFKVKTPHILVLYKRVKELEKEIGLPVLYEWVARNENVLADNLVNDAHKL